MNKKRFFKKVEWIKGNPLTRTSTIIWSLLVPIVILSIWIPANNPFTKAIFSVNILWLFLMCFVKEPIFGWGKRIKYYEEG